MIKKETEKFSKSNIFEGMSSISALIKGIESGVNDRRIVRVLFDQTKVKSKYAELRFLKSKADALGFTVQAVDPALLNEMTIGNTHGGIIAECSERTIPSLSKDLIEDHGVYFMLEGVEDPYNFGYAIRSLYAAGVSGVILSPRNWMGVAGVVARSSAGTSELIHMYVATPTDAIQLFKDKGYTVLCAGIRDSVSIYDTPLLKKPLLMILGGEKRGISRAVLEQADQVIRIDYGNSFAGSLSTSAAAAVFAFEILRSNRNF